jgi:hypothetical protein
MLEERAVSVRGATVVVRRSFGGGRALRGTVRLKPDRTDSMQTRTTSIRSRAKERTER